jgi:hypothetical protein
VADIYAAVLAEVRATSPIALTQSQE